MSCKAFLLRVGVGCVVGMLSLPTQGYNSPGGAGPDIRGGHAWITNQTIEYLKRVDPFVYVFANKYREQIVYGAWYADHNSGRCDIGWPVSEHWPCDSTNHYQPRFHYTPRDLGMGVEGSVSLAEYARDLFKVASTCWALRDVPENLPLDLCGVPNWRAIHDINLVGDFGVFSQDGELVRKSPAKLLGWALHMLQDTTQIYHVHSEPSNGHQESEDYVDDFIAAGKADKLPSTTIGAGLEVSTAEGFVSAVASETMWNNIDVLNGRRPNFSCCKQSEVQNDAFTETNLNRAIIYSAKLISFYFRGPANGLAAAVFDL